MREKDFFFFKILIQQINPILNSFLFKNMLKWLKKRYNRKVSESEEFMIIRSEKDQAGMLAVSQACAIARQAMLEAIEVGITTLELDEIARKVLKEHDALSAPEHFYDFPGCTCISVNEVVAHGIPSGYQLQEGDKVNVDVSAILDGYCGDTGATVFVGETTKRRAKLLRASEDALRAGILEARAGNQLNRIGGAIFQEARKHGFTVIKNLCGHGIGKSLHEEPNEIMNYLERTQKYRLPEGVILAIETFISESDEVVYEGSDGWTLTTQKKSWVTQFEHTIQVTKEGPKILTALPYGLQYSMP